MGECIQGAFSSGGGSGVSLDEANTWTATQTFEDDIETTQGIKYPASLKRNFEESFNGAVIKPYWIFGNIVGAGSGALTTGVGNGFKITSAGTTNDRSGISTNSLFMMSSRSLTMYGIFKFDNSENITIEGVANSVDSELGKSVACLLDTDNTNIALHLSDSSISDTESDVALSTGEVYWKIICNGTNARLFLIVDNVWTLKVTATTQYPNVGVSPNCFVKTLNASTAIADFLYFKVIQD